MPAGLMERAEKANTSDEAFKQFGIQESGERAEEVVGGYLESRWPKKKLGVSTQNKRVHGPIF